VERRRARQRWDLADDDTVSVLRASSHSGFIKGCSFPPHVERGFVFPILRQEDSFDRVSPRSTCREIVPHPLLSGQVPGGTAQGVLLVVTAATGGSRPI
jgi:hypothetical protein